MYIDNTMISEVERNQKLMKVGDNIIYCDMANLQTWVVTELIEGGFIAYNREFDESSDFEDGHDVFYFSELQLGWDFSEKTKQKNFLDYRFKYV